MSNRRRASSGDPRKRPIRAKVVKGTDPRKLGGTSAGPGGAFDRHAQVVDTTDAVLADDVAALVVHFPDDDRDVFGLLLGGRINRTDERASALFLLDTRGAASIVAELVGVGMREDGPLAARLSREIDAALERLPRSPEDEASS